MTPFFRALGGAMLAFMLPLMIAAPAAAQTFDENQKREIEDIVRDYILENPEIIAEAVKILQERADNAQLESTRQAIIENRDLLENDPLSIVLGNPDGDITIVELYDYRCPYCREIHGDLNRLIEQDKGIRLVLKQFPVKDRVGETPVSLISARLAQVAARHGVFEEFHNAMFDAEPPLTEAKVFAIAEQVGLDPDTIQDEMQAPEVTQHIRETLRLANDLGSTGTPTFVIDDYMIPGLISFDNLVEFIGYVREFRKENAGQGPADSSK